MLLWMALCLVVGILSSRSTVALQSVTTRSSFLKALLLSSSQQHLVNYVGAFLLASPTCSLDSSSQRSFSTMSTNDKIDSERTIRILLNGGDNMFGRAVQLSFPVQAKGEEDIMDSCTAKHYLELCLHPSGGKDLSLEEIRELNKNGRYLWGDYLATTISPPPDLRILNLETAVTHSIDNKDVPFYKGIRYHMHVDNLTPVMKAFVDTTHGGQHSSPVVVSYANNHCMDYGRIAFERETLPAFRRESFQMIGSGQNWSEAIRPAVVGCGKTVVKVFAFAAECSGTYQSWHATKSQSGVAGLPALYGKRGVEEALCIVKKAFRESCNECSGEDSAIKIVSIHWGPNWALKGEDGEDLSARRELAHRLVDECGVDLIYGHSSHHVRGSELYKGKLILYGTGDMINDYEGFENAGEEKYNRLGGLYLVDMNAESGDLVELRIVPMFMNRLRLERWKPTSLMWKPRARKLQNDPAYAKHMCKFVNELSAVDAGSKSSAVLVDYKEQDEDLPGGPILHFYTKGTLIKYE